MSSTSAAKVVATAAGQSASKKTLGMTLVVTAADPSRSTPQRLSGQGAFYLSSGLGALSVKLSAATSQDQKFILQGHSVFVNVTDSPVPGKSWVVAGTDHLPALGPGSTVSNLIELVGNPGLLVQQLTSTSLAVAPVGSSIVDGTLVQRYAVTFSDPKTTSAAGFGTHTSEEVDIGPDKLVQRIVIPAPPITVRSRAVRENVVVSFSQYGSPLFVGTPPFGQMLSLSQYVTPVHAP